MLNVTGIVFLTRNEVFFKWAIFVFFKQTLQFLKQIYVKKCYDHPVYLEIEVIPIGPLMLVVSLYEFSVFLLWSFFIILANNSIN